jgi:hypothetical protein
MVQTRVMHLKQLETALKLHSGAKEIWDQDQTDQWDLRQKVIWDQDQTDQWDLRQEIWLGQDQMDQWDLRQKVIWDQDQTDQWDLRQRAAIHYLGQELLLQMEECHRRIQ